ncbi:MAG: NAD(P)-dependent alcohol dehydrogenase [Candidatus Limnocylindria bacterium]
MKAIRKLRYGSPDVLEVHEVDPPEVPDDAVLVRVRATSVNAHDWHMLRGKPYMARLGDGLRRPKSPLVGIDVAGTVEAAGADVRDLQAGDRVFGARSGAFAEYVASKNMVPMPADLTFEQAAAVPIAGFTALQGIRDVGNLQPDHRVLVNGAGGGVGSFAVQIARALGADVTAVTNTGNLEMVASIGADRVIDYSREDFTRGRDRYDLIVDAGGNHSLRALRRALTPAGTVVMVAPGPGQWIGPVARIGWAIISSRFSDRKVRPFLADASRDDMFVLRELIEAGKITPVIDRTFPFDQIPDAIRYVEEGRARGKVVITV